VLTPLEGQVWVWLYPLAYAVKISAVTLSLILISGSTLRREIKPSRAVLLPSILAGLATFVLWVGIDTFVPYPHLGSRVGFDPSLHIEDADALGVFLFVRLCGLILIVPVMEELFWRSFLLRYLTNPRFDAEPIGTYSVQALWLTSGLAALAHPEWLVALIANLVYGWLVKKTRSLYAVVIAHAVTNAALAIYILSNQDWRYW
jgi:CAAX prenyl protease-like protein